MKKETPKTIFTLNDQGVIANQAQGTLTIRTEKCLIVNYDSDYIHEFNERCCSTSL